MRVRLRTIEFAPRDRRNIAAANGWDGEATRDELAKWVYDAIDRELRILDARVFAMKRQPEGKSMFPDETLVKYHLSYNVYPPLSESFVPMVMGAIRAYEEGNYDRAVDGPNGIKMRASEVVKEFNLDGLLPPLES